MNSLFSSAHLNALLGAIKQVPNAAILATDSAGRIQLWNEGAENLLGFPLEQALGRDVLSLLDGQAPEKLLSFYRHALAGEAVTFQAAARHAAGHPVDLSFSILPLYADRRVEGLVFVACTVATMEPEELSRLRTERHILEQVLLQATDRENRRIGQELHDHLCQHLLGAAFSAKALARRQAADPVAASQLDELARLINTAVEQVRELTRGLTPAGLNAEGLPKALQDLASRPRGGVACQFECTQAIRLPDADSARHAFRIAHEALGDAIEYGRATEVTIRLFEDHEQVHLQIADNGPDGTPEESALRQRSFEIIRCRAQAIGAVVRMDTAKRVGTLVTCSLTKPR